MSPIQGELERLSRSLREPQSPERYAQLYAAQQALAWAVDPETYAGPESTIQCGLVQPPTCTQEAQANCSDAGHPLAS